MVAKYEYNMENPSDYTYIFDVDGTLTPPRHFIDLRFQGYFFEWIQDKDVYLVSGSDFRKVMQQVGNDIFTGVNGVFCCSGNTYYIGNTLVRYNPFTYHRLPELELYLNYILTNSKYPIKTSNHVEHRDGMINFSIVGRDCTDNQRRDYYQWDIVYAERVGICNILMAKFPELQVDIGGQISVDIYLKGRDKSQILPCISGKKWFFGDKIDIGGNDYAIARALRYPNKVTKVKDWRHTWDELKRIANWRLTFDDI